MDSSLLEKYEDKQGLDYFLRTRREMLTFIPKTCQRLLDVGCSAGGFGELVKQTLSAEVWGIDISPSATAIADKKLDRVINDAYSAEVKDLAGQKFDVITFNDSLEHFPDPYPPLALSKQLLSEDGVVVCCLPNVRYIENVFHFLVEMDWEYQEQGVLDNTHLRFFTKKSMLRTFDMAGYDVLGITGIKPHYWSGKKIFLLRLFFRKWVDDMKYLNYVIVAKPKGSN